MGLGLGIIVGSLGFDIFVSGNPHTSALLQWEKVSEGRMRGSGLSMRHTFETKPDHFPIALYHAKH